jgi:arginine exporter protein ArgO
MLKKFRAKNEFLACFSVFSVLAFSVLAMMNGKSHKAHRKSKMWTHINEAS